MEMQISLKSEDFKEFYQIALNIIGKVIGGQKILGVNVKRDGDTFKGTLRTQPASELDCLLQEV